MPAASFTPLEPQGLVLIRPARFQDGRGYFMETFRADDYKANGIDAAFVQDNQSGSARRGTIRGFHFQAPPHAQAKLVRVISGAILDVSVDIRTGSPTYGRACAVELTAEGGEQLYVPEGFAHAYCTLTENAQIAYKVNRYYNPEAEQGLRWNDPALSIDWTVSEEEAVLSNRDRSWPDLESFDSPFTADP